MEKNESSVSPARETATLAGGCFWCLEAVFLELRGVESVVSGYSGGSVENPSYREVTTGTTGHAEAVQIVFRSESISYRDILEVFFTIHDPTTLNRQGPDVGTQYRSAIFYHTEEQKNTAETVMRDLERSGVWQDPAVTEITPFQNFYKAEAYHQNYYRQNSDAPYCRFMIAPKIMKLRKHFLDKLKK